MPGHHFLLILVVDLVVVINMINPIQAPILMTEQIPFWFTMFSHGFMRIPTIVVDRLFLMDEMVGKEDLGNLGR